MANTGLAFSGGGIRSAAFCSGVLRRLLERGVEVDFLSCVSGGGYTGTAYLDWKYREERKARTKAEEGEETELVQGKENDWHEDFFNHMTQRSGYICNWMEPLKGILDTLVFSCLVMMVTVIQPIIKWGSYACPVAFIIDFFFGNLMRDAADCDAELADASTSSSRDEEIHRCLQGTDDVHTVILFTALFILFSASFVLLRLIKRSCRMLKIFLHLSQYIFGSFFVFTFIPFTIYDFFATIPLWAQIFVGVTAVTIWFVLPLLRSKTSYVLIIYIYSYVIYWKVYQLKLFGHIAYSEFIFHWLLGASGIALWMVPLASTVQERLVHVYNRWRLQKSFYHKDALGPCRCSGIRVQDICPLCTCLPRNEQQSTDATRPLTLADLKGMKPEYLSNMVVNRWKMSHDCKEKYELLIMSPTGIERFDRDPNKKQFEGRLEPEDVMLSDAMATSAAALSTHMGKYDQSITGLTRLYTILDLEMGATMVTNAKSLKQESLALKIAAYLVHILRGLPLIAVQIIYVYDDSATTTFESSVKVAMFIYLIIHIVLTIIALIDTGASQPRWWERLARWFIVHNSFVYYVREIFAKNNIGPVPPPIMLLSDGGHVENLAILPLLKRRLPTIVVVDGGYKGGDTFYGESILKAMDLARTKLKCSFLSEEGKDVISDLREKFAKQQNGGNPRHYKFKVNYQNNESGDDGEGEILLIIPNNSQPNVSDCVETAVGDLHGETAVIDLHGRELDEREGKFHDDVSKLTFSCCERCHRKSCQRLSKILCNVFPHTNTANQFFTPRMFSAYHHEGYRACVEANADDFLRTVITERQQCAGCE